MQVYDAPFAHSAKGSRPGLVLLYAPLYEKISPAYVFQDRDIIIGREPTSDIRIPEAAISRRHACISQKNGRWVLADLGGRNGTLVNGEFVRDEVALEHLDEIRIGNATFKFVEEDAEGYARYRIDGVILEGPGTGDGRASFPAGRIVGGYQVRRLARGLHTIAQSTLSAVILGESGTGKEVFAQQLHDWSGRSGPFLAINCAAIPAALLEGELFGHKRGAFSGADRDRVGLIRAAHGGTLFLDEIGDMPLEAQAKLLRVLQSKEVVPLGATQPERVDLRVVCATHRDVAKLLQSGGFRVDLFARVNEYSLTLPPLRERKEDIFSLCHAFAARNGKPDLEVTVPFMAGLLRYDFPFNVRELEALIRRWAATSGEGRLLDVPHLSDEIKARMRTYALRSATPAKPPSPAPSASTAPLPPPPASSAHAAAAAVPPPARVSTPSEQELRALLAEHRGNIAAVGRLFRKDRAQVHRWVKRYGINIDEYR